MDDNVAKTVFVGLGVTIVGGLVVWAIQIGRENEKTNLPLEHQGARVKPDGTDFDVVNPATKPRRIYEAWFRVERTEPPSQECCAGIDKVDITFAASDYIRKHNSYYKRLGEDEIRAQEEGIFRVRIIDPRRVGWRYHGTLVIVYGDKQEPKYDTWKGYFITVSDVNKANSPAAVAPASKQDYRVIPSDGTAPDGRRPLHRRFQGLPQESSYQNPAAD